MNKAKFFAHLRRADIGLFGSSLSQRQVIATESLLDEGDGLTVDHMAHVLSECYHETGGGMYPVKETVFQHHSNQNPSDAAVIKRLDTAFSNGSLPWVRTPYWRDGWFGRGGIQITHKDNYRKLSPVAGVDLVSHPEKALDPIVSAKIAVHGCRLGMFTGRKLSDFDGPYGFDHYGARAIVNGDKRDNGEKIADYARSFANALRSCGWGVTECEPKKQTGLIGVILALFGKALK